MALSNNHSSVIKGKQNDIPVSSCGSQRQGDGSRNICQGGEKVCIFKVPDPMINSNRDAYVPCIVSLGPYHQGEKSTMDKYKRQAVRRLATRINKKEECLMEEIQKLEKEIREHYEEEEINCDGEKLWWMMTDDACFILEFFKCAAETRDDQNIQGCYSHVFQNKGYKNCMHSAILTDIMKLQNQVPMFILIKLLQLEFADAKRELARILSNSNPFKGFPFNSKQENDEDIKSKLEKYIEENPCHLLDLYRMVISDRLIPSSESFRAESSRSELSTAYRCGYQQLPSSNVGAQPHKDKEKLERYIPCAEKLENAGIEIKSGPIKFQKTKFGISKLFLPQITVKYRTETLLRNLVAYEECQRCSSNPKKPVISSYVNLLDKLIDSEKDVALLHDSKIIKSFVGSDEVIVGMFNKLAIGMTVEPPDGDRIENFESIPQLDEVMADARKHYKNKWNRLMSEFHQTYFSKPWYIVSLLAATALLVMTLIQTVYAVK
ncbi:putative UPF0481 protein At3g02645 [Cryptomeria japonica]|uniref:putative UPF0481 protein At3g02645 n=1 Tax=Cryptomeria japonica TaxID=3369 RepID=UPI0027DA21B9|nr:putative UPF0481 protein At3g02645 [Cryptomeria japonica]